MGFHNNRLPVQITTKKYNGGVVNISLEISPKTHKMEEGGQKRLSKYKWKNNIHCCYRRSSEIILKCAKFK